MIYSYEQLKQKYLNYSDIKGKIAREIKKENYLPLKKGIYETNKNIDPSLLASFINNPSYLSFDYALSRYGLIPEGTYNVYTLASFQNRKTKKYTNYFGTYYYRDVPSEVFYKGISSSIIDGYPYLIATKEKALCDKLYVISPVRSLKELEYILFRDLRIDEEDFFNLNFDSLLEFAPLYKSTTLNMLIKYINKIGKEEKYNNN